MDRTHTGEAARHTRFSSLPERIPFEDMTEEVEAERVRDSGSYSPEGSWRYSTCLALDLGL